MSTHKTPLAISLRECRLRAGLTIRQLAAASGLAASTLYRLESGEIAKPRPSYLQQIARALSIDVENLYADAGYLLTDGMPELQPYLRSKYNLSPSEAAQIDEIFEALRAKWES